MNKLFACVRNDKRSVVIDSSFVFSNNLIYSYLFKVYYILINLVFSLFNEIMIKLKEDSSVF